jgi:adenylate cyclase
VDLSALTLPRRLALGVALGLLAAALAVALGVIPLLRTVEWKVYDQHVRWAADPGAARRDLAVVKIDERSIRELEPFVGRWPWPRLVHAKIVDFLALGGARAIAYDVLLLERDRRLAFEVGGDTWSGAESDQALADAVARAGRVVLLADAAEDLAPRPIEASDLARWTYEAGSGFEPRRGFAVPWPELAKAARAIGHNAFTLDADGPLRRHVPFLQIGARALPSLSVATAITATNVAPDAVRAEPGGVRLGGLHVPLLDERIEQFAAERGAVPAPGSRRVLINYRGPALLPDGVGTVYREYSALDLLQASEQVQAGLPPVVDPAVFRDKIVVVGVTAAGLHDVFTVPFTAAGKMSGAVIHATLVDQLLSSNFVTPARPPARWAAALALPVLAGLAFLIWSPGLAGLATALLAAAYAGGSHWAFRRGVWLPLVVPWLGAALAAVGGLAWHYFVEGREKRAVKRLFSRYLSHDVYEQLLKDPALAELGGSRREMTVLFSDLRGFTTFTEQGRPEEVVRQLNEYLSRMVEVVFAHRGTVDKFVGDMVVALFGAPLEDPDHADHAVAAALDMCRELDALNARWAAEGRPVLAVGIGVNTGEMIAGNVGSSRIQSYTVIGDAVNLGARLQALNKDYGTTIIVSAETARRLTSAYELRPLGSAVVKGRSKPVELFEVRPGPRAPLKR